MGALNGTWIDGEQVEEAMLGAGQTLQLGDVRFVLQASAAVRVGSGLPRATRAAAPMTFWRGLATAFGYPFRGNGAVLMLAGTLALGLTALAIMLAGNAWIFGWVAVPILIIGMTGYAFAYIKDVIATSAHGDETLPSWPEVTSPADFVMPCVQLVALAAVSFGPAFLWSRWGPEAGVAWVAVGLGVLGAFYFPMALVGVALADSVAGLNPLVVVPSILRILGHYLVAFGLVVVLFAVEFGGNWLAARVPIPVVPTLLAEFTTLYVAVVTARTLGVMYHVNRDALGWFR
jgi:hypothetical protein